MTNDNQFLVVIAPDTKEHIYTANRVAGVVAIGGAVGDGPYMVEFKPRRGRKWRPLVVGQRLEPLDQVRIRAKDIQRFVCVTFRQ